MAGRKFEPIAPEDLQRVFAPAAGGDKLRIAERISALSGGDINTGERAKNLAQSLGVADPKDLSRALQTIDITKPSPAAAGLRSDITEGLGGRKDAIPALRREVQNLVRQTGDKTILPKFKPWRVGGGLGGLALGSALTGIPLALRALYLKGQGGEAAARARARAEAAIGRAEETSGAREDILQPLEQAR